MTPFEIMAKKIDSDEYEPQTHYSRDPARYREELTEMKDKLRLDLESAFSIQGHPKAQLLFDISWEEGTPLDYFGILHYYSTLIQLLS